MTAHGAAGLTLMLPSQPVGQLGQPGQVPSHGVRPSQHGVAVGQAQAGLTMEIHLLQIQPVHLQSQLLQIQHLQLQRSLQICDSVGVATSGLIPKRVNASTPPAGRGREEEGRSRRWR